MRVWVCMPTWNGEAHLPAQLASILADLPEDARVLVRDDGSVDGTLRVIEDFARRDDRIRLIEGGTRLGVAGSVGRLLAEVSDGVVLLSDQDDVWRPGRTRRCLRALEECDLVVHDASRIDAGGRPLGGTLFDLRGRGGGFAANVLRNRFTGCCMALRATLLRHALPFPARLPMHDQWLGLVALRKGRVAWLDDVLLDYRVHGSNATATGTGRSKAGTCRRIAWRLQALQAILR